MSWLALVVASLLLVSVNGAAAAEPPESGPSADELWRSYPLEPDPADSPAPAGEAVGEPSAGDPASEPAAGGAAVEPAGEAADSGDEQAAEPSSLALLAAVPALLAALALAPLLRRRRGRRGAKPGAGPRPAADGGGPSPADLGWLATTLPPDPLRRWDAEIRWRESGQASRFDVVARASEGTGEAVIGRSAPVPWPPSGPEAVEAMTEAADALARAARVAGWRATAAGPAWYAKRFVWEPGTRTATQATAPPGAPAESSPEPPSEGSPGPRAEAPPAPSARSPVSSG